METVRLWLSALMTPVIAALGLWIAYQQYRIQQYRLKHDLSERRYAILAAARDLIVAAVSSRRTPEDAFFRFRASIVGASFVFGTDVVAYLDGLRERYSRMLEIEDIKADNAFEGDDQRGSLLEELRNRRQAMRAELEKIDDIFRPYFDLSAV